MDVRCLGPLEVVEAGRPRSLGGPKQRLVLAHLVIRANHVVPVDRLIAEVWDDDPPSAARGSLQSYVSHLRSALGADRIESTGQGYALRLERDEVDRSRFEALVAEGRRLRATDPARAAALLRDALKLWRGPPFADLSDAASLRPEITRLAELQLAAVEDRVGADLDLGRDRELVGELEALTAEHPLREGLWGQLMLALYRAGRQGDALLAFDRARRVLVDELGIDPSAGLRALHEQVLRQDPTLGSATSSLKGYRLRERVGEGRFGVTWRAMQPGVDRDVAIKVARPAMANDPEFIRRFAADAQRVAQLEHPHVVPLYDFWREPDGAYLVMRYLRGGSLRDLLDREGPPEHTDAVRIADQIAQALAAAHRQGVVHGNITPANVLLDDEGNAYLSGFLVGRNGAPADSDRDADELAYVPPERTTTDGTDDPRPRGDVYALGVLLGQLLPDADAAVAEVLGRATAPHPDQRQQDGRALLAELRGALEPTPPIVGAAATGTVVADGAGLRNPYKGLRAFLESDAGDFFGRRTMIARLLSSLREHGRFLAVVGPSGSGKSSVVRAGLVPALRAGALHGSGSWFIVQMVPGNRPFDELATAVRHVAVDPPEHLAGHLADEGLAAVAPLLPDDGDLLVIIDQFEELFTLVTDDDRRNRFIDALVKAVDADDGRVRVVVTLRADFYDRPLEHAGLGALMQAHTHTLLPLAAGELEQAVTGPAESVGVAVERRLVAQMVADVTDQPGALPLLQYALTELFDNRRDATLTVAAYQAIGGVAGALSRRAEAVFSSLDNDAREAARQLFLRLVTPGEGVEDTRRRTSVAEVVALAPDDIPGVLDVFGDARLLSFDRDPESRAPTVEVAHEALLREWRRLRGWIDAARHDLRTQRRLQTAAADWIAADRDPSFLATGSQLAQYEAWREGSGLTASGTESEYLDASIEHRDRAAAEEEARRRRELDLERRSVRRLRTLVAVLGIAALIAGGLTIFAIGEARRAADQTVRAEREARIATAGGLVAAADASLDADPERSILLALEAINVTRAADGTVLSEAEEALHRAVGASRIVRRFTDVGGDVDWHPDGTTLVHEGADSAGVVEILDAATGEQVQSWQGHDGDVHTVEFSPDGSMLATTGNDGAARIWDPHTGEELAALEEEDGEVGGSAFSADSALFAVVSLRTKECSWASPCGGVKVSDIRSGRVILDRRLGRRAPLTTAFSPDGERLAIGFDRPPEAIVIDVRTGRPLVTLAAHSRPILDAAWSPDGRWLATTSDDNTARIWDGRTGEPRSTLSSHSAAVRDVDWHPGSTRLVLGSVDGTATVWQITDGGAQKLLSLAGEPFDGMAGVAFSPDGDRVMTGDHDGAAIAIWDVRDLGAGEWATAPAQTVTRNPIDFTHDGAGVVATDDNGLVTIWDATDSSTRRATTEHITSDTDPRFLDSVSEVHRLDANPAHPLVAAAGYPELGAGGAFTAIVWDTDTGEQVFAVRHDHLVSDVAWTGDGELLATSDFGGVIRVVDRSGTELAVLRDEEDRPIDSLQFSPDGRHIIAATWTEQAVPVSVWDWEQAEVVHVIDDHRSPVAFAFDADGGRVVIADGEGYAAVWDTASWTQLTTFTGHAGPVEAVDVAPDGQSVATAGAAGTVRIWDLATGAERLTLEAHGGIVWGIAFSPDGTRLASAGDDGQVRVWALDTDDLIRIARSKLTRSLTDAECREYLHVDECPAE